MFGSFSIRGAGRGRARASQGWQPASPRVTGVQWPEVLSGSTLGRSGYCPWKLQSNEVLGQEPRVCEEGGCQPIGVGKSWESYFFAEGEEIECSGGSDEDDRGGCDNLYCAESLSCVCSTELQQGEGVHGALSDGDDEALTEPLLEAPDWTPSYGSFSNDMACEEFTAYEEMSPTATIIYPRFSRMWEDVDDQRS